MEVDEWNYEGDFAFPSANSHFNKFNAAGSSFQRSTVVREVNNTRQQQFGLLA